jgi:predicted anti-sigma-YlaC factor YlaD
MNTLIQHIRRFFGREPLSCEQVNAFLVAYLEGTLDVRTRTLFEAHIGACPVCSAYFDQYRSTIAMVKEDPLPEPPQELVESTLAFLRTHYPDGRPDA